MIPPSRDGPSPKESPKCLQIALNGSLGGYGMQLGEMLQVANVARTQSTHGGRHRATQTQPVISAVLGLGEGRGLLLRTSVRNFIAYIVFQPFTMDCVTLWVYLCPTFCFHFFILLLKNKTKSNQESKVLRK
jgi:hypothetical protein